MLPMSDASQELLEKLNAPLQAHDFEALAAMVSEVSDEAVLPVIEELNKSLQQWSSDESVVDSMSSWAWMQRMLKGEDEPRLLLTRSMICEFDGPSAEGWDNLIACPYLGNVTHLHFSDMDLHGRGAALFAQLHTIAPKLKSLYFTESGLEDEVVEALVASPTIAELVNLNLSNNALGSDSIAALVECAQIKSLTTLSLDFMELGRDAKQKIADASWYSRLDSFELEAAEELDTYDENYYDDVD